MKLRQIAEETLARHWVGTKSERTSWLNAVDVLARLGDVDGDEVNERMIDDLVASLERDGLAPATVNRKLAALSRILRHGYSRGHVARLPIIERRREPRGRIRWLTADEEFAVLREVRSMKPVMADFIEFLIDTGARTGEALALEWLDFERRYSEGRLIRMSVHFWNVKNGRPRTVPLTLRAMDAVIRQEGADDKLVFGASFTKCQFRHTWDKMRRRLLPDGDDQFVPHCLRHTCASRLVQLGIDIRVVQEFLGHAAITTTLRYSHLAPDTLDRARNALEGNSLDSPARPARVG